MTAHRYKNLNETAFVRVIGNLDWTCMLTNNDPSEAWDRFVECFNHVLDRHAPWESMRFDGDLPAWVTKEYLSECKQRYIALRKSRKTKRLVDGARYRRLKNKVVRFRNTLKQDFFITAFNEAGTD